MKSYKVEYLSVINSKEDFCKSTISFNHLLQSYESIEIADGIVRFKEASFGYEVQCGDINDRNQRFFHVKLTCEKEEDFDLFKKLLKSVRTILHKASDRPPEILWNDLSSRLSCKAYPVIYDIENTMRKLITKFMLTNVGIAWTKDTIPKEVSESIKGKKKTSSQNYLHETDFIQLSNFLFKEYSTANSKKLIEKLRKAENINDLSIDDLKEMVPQSNWERYFSPIVDCSSEYLENRWKRLYDLRCIVAHNKFITEEEFNELVKLSKEIKEKLLSAIENLDKVNVTDEQKEEVAENVASNMKSIYGEFIITFNLYQEVLLHLYNIVFKEKPIHNKARVQFSKAVVRELESVGKIPKGFYRRYRELNDIRNTIVHNVDIYLSEGSVYDAIGQLNDLKDTIIKIVEAYD